MTSDLEFLAASDVGAPSAIDGYRMSPLQISLWRHGAGDGESFIAWLRAELQSLPERFELEANLKRSVDRHEILRTRFAITPGLSEPLQCIEPTMSPDLRWYEARSEEDALALLDADRLRPFDLARGPMLRASVAERSDGSGWLQIALPTMVIDREGLGILFAELAVPVLDDPIQYADAAAWLDDLLSSPHAVVAREHWRRQGPLSTVDLRLPEWGPPTLGSLRFRPRRLRRRLGTVGRLRVAARALDASEEDVLLAAWFGLVGRATESWDLTLGVLVRGRGTADLAGALGPFDRYLPVRVELSADATLAWVTAEVSQRLAAARSHAEFFSWDLFPEWPGGFAPIAFDVDLDLPDSIERDATLDRFAARASIGRAGEVLETTLSFDPEQYGEAALSALLEAWTTFFEAACDGPDRAFGEVPLGGAEVRRRLVTDFNRVDPSPQVSLLASIARQVARNGDSRAVVCGSEAITYAELESRSDRLAERLRELAIGPDVLAAIFLPRSTASVVALVAVLKAGGAYLPIEIETPAERVAWILADSEAALVIADRSTADRLPAGTRWLDPELSDSHYESLPLRRFGPIDPESLAYVIYTSGSTGRPKGVMVTHRGLSNYLGWSCGSYGSYGSALAHSPLAFDLTVTSVLTPLATGATVRLVEGAEGVESLARALCESDEAGLLKITPAHLEGLSGLLPPEGAAAARVMVIGGESLRFESLAFWRGGAPSPRLFNEYGPTETVVGCCVHEVVAGDPDFGPVPIGRPIGGASLYLLDGQGEPLPEGFRGELFIGGVGVARGYVGRPDLTAWSFPPDPFGAVAGARLYRTGDLAIHRTDGELEFVGRIDDQVKLRGHRIELGEIEAVLAEHPGVVRAAVLLERAGPAPRLIAYVSPTDGASEVELKEHLAARVSAPMVPAEIFLLPDLPLTRNGKVDRRALAALPKDRPARRRWAPPRNEIESRIAAVWRELLQVERVGIHDGFFDLGGDSILSIQAVARMNRHGIRLTPRQLFAHQTIAELAPLILATEEAPADFYDETLEAPLVPMQRWFLEMEFEDRHHFNQSLLLAVKEPDTQAIRHAVDRILAQHDALRLRFERSEGDWRQRIESVPSGSPFGQVDLAALPLAKLQSTLSAGCESLQTSLDLFFGPIFRVVLFRFTPADARLFLLAHHLAVDVVSWWIVLDDMERAAAAFKARRPFEGATGSATFARAASAMERRALAPESAAEVASWVARSPQEVPPLPWDSEVVDRVGNARTVSVSLSSESTRSLLTDANRPYRTRIQELLVTALALALVEWTGEVGILIDLEGHGRDDLDDLDLSRTVGWFTAVYSLWLEPGRASDPGIAICAIKESMRSITKGGAGFGRLRYMGDQASRAALAQLPNASVIFNYLGQVDRALRTDGPFAPAAEPSGTSRSPRQRRPYPLSILGVVAAGRLELSFEVAAGREEAVARLARRTVEWLGEIVEHCSKPETGAYTAADFAGVRLNERSLRRLRQLSPAIDALYRLTPLQQGLLFHSLAEPDSGVYAERMVGVLRGHLDQTAFVGAWREVIARHGILRTAFVVDGVPEPLQAVLREVPFEIAWRDLRGFEPGDQRRIFDQLLAFDRSLPFDLARPPLLRLTLLRESDDAHRFLWSHHHLVLDGWSSAIVLEEILKSYLALVAGGEAGLERPRSYGEYVAWLESRDHCEAERVWRAALEGLSGSSFLAGAAFRKAEGERYGEAARRLGALESRALDRFARGRGLTNNSLVQGGWALLLGRWLGSDDLVFGATSSNRPAELPDIEKMVGVFINTLPVRARLPLELPLGAWLSALQDQQVSLREFDFAALPQIQAWAGLPSGQELFDTLLVFENYPLGELLEADRQRELHLDEARPLDSTHYPVTLIVTPGRELGFRLLYERNRIDPGTAARWLEQLAWLLSRLPVLAGVPVDALSVLTPAEQHAILKEDNDTAANIDDQPLHLKIARKANRWPDAIAVECCGQFLSYGELTGQSGRLSGYLKGLGVRLDDRVGLCLRRGPDLAVAVLGILGAGAGYVPLDPAYPRDRIAMMLKDCGARWVVAERATSGAVAPDRAVLLDRDQGAIGGAPPMPPIGDPAGLAYLIYTSGSTGRPKGVAMPHRALTNLISWQLGQWPESEQRILQFASPSFDVSFQELFSAWAAGGTVVMVDEESRRDPDLLVRRIESLEVTRLFVPFVMLELFAEAAARRPEVPRSLVEVVTAGEQLRLSPPVAALFLSSGLELHNQYGPSETHVVTAWRLDKRSDDWPELPPIGRAIANVRLYLLDGGMRLLSPGALGEIYLGGVALARGYFDRPSLTAERFVPDAYSGMPGARLYRTGDLGRRLGDGTVEFLGRSDSQVKVRGFRVELAEIEQELARHPGVATAVVTAPAAKLGGGAVLSAHFVPHEGTDPSAHELRSFLASKLPEFMLPASFVRLDRFPLTPSGKVDRRALASSSSEIQVTEGSPLTGPVEELLAEIWFDLLGSRPGKNDDFFASGGHSLVATRLVSRARDAFEIELPLRCVFERSRFGDLAAEIERRRAAGAGRSLPPIGPADRGCPLPLSFGQRRLWFLDRLSGGTAAYNLPFAVRLRGALDESVLAASFGDLIQRHEVLRTVFREVDGEPIQVVLAQRGVAAVQVDLEALPPALAERTARGLASRNAECPFDLAEGPLARFLMMRIDGRELYLALTLHHAISDGVSMEILFEELVAFYAARISGRAAMLPDLQLQYADFASWQRGWLSGEALAEQLGYWVERLRDAPAELNLRGAMSRSAVRSKLADRIPLRFDRDLMPRLAALCGRLEATPFMVLLSTFNLFLAHLSGERDLLVGTPVANRRTAEVEKMIGFFVNTLVLRQTYVGDPSFSEIVGEMRATALDAWSHQDLPFERLVEALHPDRFFDRSPFFQVWFVLQSSPPQMPGLPGLDLEPEDLATGLARHDLVLNLIEVEGCLYGSFEFRADLWGKADARRYGSMFEALLHEVVARPELRLERWFAFLTKTEEDWQRREASDFRDERRNELKGLGLRRAKPEFPLPIGVVGTSP